MFLAGSIRYLATIVAVRTGDFRSDQRTGCCANGRSGQVAASRAVIGAAVVAMAVVVFHDHVVATMIPAVVTAVLSSVVAPVITAMVSAADNVMGHCDPAAAEEQGSANTKKSDRAKPHSFSSSSSVSLTSSQ